MREGWHDYKPTGFDVPGRTMPLYDKAPEEYWVERRAIPSYFTDDITRCINIYNKYKMFGFPWSGGSQDQPAKLLDIIMTIEPEANKPRIKSGS